MPTNISLKAPEEDGYAETAKAYEERQRQMTSLACTNCSWRGEEAQLSTFPLGGKCPVCGDEVRKLADAETPLLAKVKLTAAEVKAMNKWQQVQILREFGLNKREIAQLKFEESRIQGILALQEGGR